MDEAIATDTPTTETGSESDFNMERAVDSIAAELFRDSREESDEKVTGPLGGATVTPVPETPEPVVADTAVSEPVLRTVPKAWPKEMHEHWGKVDPKVQEYLELREEQMVKGLSDYKNDATWYREFRESLQPYRETMNRLGVDERKAALELFKADHLLRYSPADQKREYFLHLAKQYDVDMNGASPAQTATPLDPAIQSLQKEFQTMKQSLNAREQADYQAAQQRVTQEVEAFASDAKAHPYFHEVAQDITALLKGGVATSLQDAYDRAVRMNPVTNAKEVAAAQQAEVTKQKENDRLNALKAKTAASTNVKSRDTKRAPTEPVGTMEDTIKESLRSIRGRTLTTP